MNETTENTLAPVDQTLDVSADAGASPLHIPSLSDILGSSEQEILGTSADSGVGTEDVTPVPQPGTQRRRGRPSSSDQIAALNQEIAALRGQIESLRSAQPSASQPQPALSPEVLGDAIARALRPEPAEPDIDPLMAIPEKVRDEYSDFIIGGLKPVVSALQQKMEQQSRGRIDALTKALQEQAEQIQQLRAQTSGVGSVRKAAITAGVLAAAPNFASVSTSPEWEAFMKSNVPMLGHVTYGALLNHISENRDVSEAVSAHLDALRAFEEATGKVQTDTASSRAGMAALGRPRGSAASSPPNVRPLDVTEEIRRTEAAIKVLESKRVKTGDDLDKLTKLFDRLKALELSAQGRAPNTQ